MYSKEEQLEIYKRIGITKEVYKLLRAEKRKQKISMAKIICNLTLKTYGNRKTNRGQWPKRSQRWSENRGGQTNIQAQFTETRLNQPNCDEL